NGTAGTCLHALHRARKRRKVRRQTEIGVLAMAETALAKRIGIKPGNKVLVLNAPQGYTLEPLPDGASVTTSASGNFEVVQLFVHNKAELDSHATEAIKALKPGG